ncbi:MAG: hypothetical protein KME43_17865 [Myxacorys chilensis ATA2-1-KO14]|nr:hypothetical protein [Myxacorys chilensis ATA2-1-KO14]
MQTDAFPLGDLEGQSGGLVETWGIEPHSCNRPFVGFGAGDCQSRPHARG